MHKRCKNYLFIENTRELCAALRKHSNSAIKKILVIHLYPFAIGDLLMATPAVLYLKDVFPNAQIDLLTDKDLLSQECAVNIIKAHSSFAKQIAQMLGLRHQRYDLGIVLNKSVNMSLLLFILAPEYFIGYIYDWQVRANFRLDIEKAFDRKTDHYTKMGIKVVDCLNNGLIENKGYPVIKLQADEISSRKIEE
ncbi:glycosyl transferase family protein [Candidatus Magnetoovum chiemensis]|nr:glycosyl transferase family protein [Candidatus Magnetoovum chiemensis]